MASGIWRDGVFYYAGWVEVRYQMMSGKYFSMSGHADTSVGVMMRILTQQLGLPDEEHVRLSFNGQAMDHTKVLGNYGIGFLYHFQPPVTVDMTVVKGNPPWPNEICRGCGKRCGQ
jgi:hypothetical protein